MTLQAANRRAVVVPIEHRRIGRFRDLLAARLPAGTDIEWAGHPDVDTARGVAFRLVLPARPNAVLPGTAHPPSAAFAIVVSRALLRGRASDESHLAEWVRAHVVGAAPAEGETDAVPLLWRFCESGTAGFDVRAERLARITAA